MDIGFLNLRPASAKVRAKLRAALDRVLDSGMYILGEEVEAFEAEFADYCGARHCVGVGNGFDALHLGLRAMGVAPGDEVIVPSNTYIATWLAVTHCGATPIPVEPDEATCNIDPAGIEPAISARTRAILPVHLYGRPANLDPILALASKHRVQVLEDAAQAHGARYKGRRIGAHGNAVAWSFYPTKNLGALGDAGAVTTNDPKIAERVRLLRNYGFSIPSRTEVCGVNSRLDPIHAAVLRVKLGDLDRSNEGRRRQASTYGALAANPKIRLPAEDPDARSSWHLYVIRHPRRDALRASLDALGIRTLIHYPVPPHLQPAYADLGYAAGRFPIAERIASEALSLPLGSHLDGAALASVVEAILAFERETPQRAGCS